MGFFNHDNSIDGTYFKRDELNRESFAKALAQKIVLEKGDTCLVLSIEGKWGEGKTSFLDILDFKIQNVCPDAQIVKFNPWLVSDAETLVQKFLIQLASQIITEEKPQYQKLAVNLLKYAEIFNALKLIPGAKPWANIAEGVFKTTGKAINALSQVEKMDLEKRKAEVEEAIKELDQPFFMVLHVLASQRDLRVDR
jgi:predicted KAP-like P-loop ATPase